MQRVTITVPDDLIELVKADVSAGRADSVSAWVADAIAEKARARAELVADLERMEQADPTTPETVEWVAAALGRPVSWAAEALHVRMPRRRRTG